MDKKKRTLKWTMLHRTMLRRSMGILLATAVVFHTLPVSACSVSASKKPETEDNAEEVWAAVDAPMTVDEHTEQQESDEASVTIGGETKYYSTLEEAFSAANGKTATITMLENAECTSDSSANPSPLAISGGTVTLDMNGKTLSGDGYGPNGGIIGVLGGSLAVQGAGTVEVQGIGMICAGGTLTVEDTNFNLVGWALSSTSSTRYPSVSAIQNGSLSKGGTIIINSGTITGEASDGQIYHHMGTTTINDVTMTGTTDANPRGVYYYYKGMLKINGGTFSNITVNSDNDVDIQSVVELLGGDCAYKYQDGTWAMDNNLKEKIIANVSVRKVPLTIRPQAETSWYYNSGEHCLQMNAAPVTEGETIVYEWYEGGTKLDCTADAYPIPGKTPAGSYAYTCKAICDGYILSHEFSFKVESCPHTDLAYAPMEGSTTHTKICHACGYTETAECTYSISLTGNEGTCQECESTLALSVEGTDNQMYDGTEKKPEVTVTVDGDALVQSAYTVTYADNKDAGIASVTVKGTSVSDTNWSLVQRFIIQKASLTIIASDQTIAYSENITKDSSSVTVTGLCQGDTLDMDSFTLTASNTDIPGGMIIPSAAVIKNSSGNDVTKNYEITYINGNLTINQAEGKLTVPEVSVSKRFGDEEFSLNCSTNSDGKISYVSSDKSVASVSEDGTVQIKGVGETTITVSLAESKNYTGDGSKKITVKVSKAAAPSVKNETKQYISTKGSGEGAVVMDIAGKLPDNRGETAYTASVISDNAGILSDVDVDADGTLNYKVKSGKEVNSEAKIQVTITMANYETANFILTIKIVDQIQVTITAEPENAVYDGSYHKGYADVTCDYPVDGYTVTYAGRDGTAYNGSEPPKDAGSYTVTISVSDESGDYQETSVFRNFTIEKASITIKADDKTVRIGAPLPELTYTVSGLAEKDRLASAPAISCHADTKTVGDYADSITVSGAKVPDTGNYSDAIKYKSGTLTVISSASSSSGGGNSTSSGNATGDGSSTGGTDTPENPQEPVPAARVKSVKLSKTVYTYTGKAKKPSVIAVDTDGKQISGEFYTVSYKNNKNVGKATVTVTFKGSYSGSVTKTFTIRPAGTVIKKLEAASGAFTIKWTGKTVQTSGYQIQYSTNAEFKGSGTNSVFVKKTSVTKQTVKKLKAGKKYYVRIRTYKTVKTDGKSTKIYSAWSKAVQVKTR